MFSYIFYAKVINYKHELDWPPGMFPQACGSWCFEVSGFVEPRADEIISELAGLRKPIGTTNNFKVDPVVMRIVCQIVFLTEFRRNVCVFDENVLRSGHWRLEVKVCGVEAGEFGARARKDTVDHEFEKVEVCRGGPYVVFDHDMPPRDGDTCTVGIGLGRADLTDNTQTFRRNSVRNVVFLHILRQSHQL